jgi:hypothetical protein
MLSKDPISVLPFSSISSCPNDSSLSIKRMIKKEKLAGL